MVPFIDVTLEMVANHCECFQHASFLVPVILMMCGSRLLHTTTGISTRPNDFFWRLSLIDHFDGCILASDKRIVRLDWRVCYDLALFVDTDTLPFPRQVIIT